MDLSEICAEKLRAINERARYRDFYDLAMAFKKKPVKSSEIVDILKKKELRKELKEEHILKNLKIAQEAKDNGLENLYYREEITKDEIENVLGKLLPLLD
ncbi:MAG: nucleotidyl transferase AbiEii/AbiGii toxin family protein [Actinomycetota bacterium]